MFHQFTTLVSVQEDADFLNLRIVDFDTPVRPNMMIEMLVFVSREISKLQPSMSFLDKQS